MAILTKHTRECSLAECVEQQEWFLESENSVDARLQIEESIDAENILDSEGSCIGAVTRSNMKQLMTKPPKETGNICCPGTVTKCDMCTVRALHFEQKILRFGRVILNMLYGERKALPFLCHYTPQKSFNMNIEFFNKINGPNQTIKSMPRLTEYRLLKRFSDCDLTT